MRVVIPVRNDRTLTDHQVEKWGFDWLTTPDAIDRLTKIAAEMAQPGRNCGRYIDDGTADQQLVGMVGHIAAASPTRIALRMRSDQILAVGYELCSPLQIRPLFQ